jgi:ribonuclease J
VLDKKGRIASGPQVRAVGMPGDEDYPLDEALDDLAEVAVEALKKLDGAAKDADDQVETAVSRAIKKASQRIWERRPIVETTVLRI